MQHNYEYGFVITVHMATVNIGAMVFGALDVFANKTKCYPYGYSHIENCVVPGLKLALLREMAMTRTERVKWQLRNN